MFQRDDPRECKKCGMETVTIQRKLLVDLVDVWSKKSLGKSGSPNHRHSVPGVWDSDNGKLAGKPCAECALYDEARRIVAESHNASLSGRGTDVTTK